MSFPRTGVCRTADSGHIDRNQYRLAAARFFRVSHLITSNQKVLTPPAAAENNILFVPGCRMLKNEAKGGIKIMKQDKMIVLIIINAIILFLYLKHVMKE